MCDIGRTAMGSTRTNPVPARGAAIAESAPMTDRDAVVRIARQPITSPAIATTPASAGQIHRTVTAGATAGCCGSAAMWFEAGGDEDRRRKASASVSALGAASYSDRKRLL